MVYIAEIQFLHLFWQGFPRPPTPQKVISLSVKMFCEKLVLAVMPDVTSVIYKLYNDFIYEEEDTVTNLLQNKAYKKNLKVMCC